jgi:hypothetical protein
MIGSSWEENVITPKSFKFFIRKNEKKKKKKKFFLKKIVFLLKIKNKC